MATLGCAPILVLTHLHGDCQTRGIFNLEWSQSLTQPLVAQTDHMEEI